MLFLINFEIIDRQGAATPRLVVFTVKLECLRIPMINRKMALKLYVLRVQDKTLLAKGIRG